MRSAVVDLTDQNPDDFQVVVHPQPPELEEVLLTDTMDGGSGEIVGAAVTEAARHDHREFGPSDPSGPCSVKHRDGKLTA